MKYFLLSLPIFSTFNIHAQIKNNPTGIYSLQGVRETASVFKLNEDSTFEFYFSYGALDRYGSGKWSVKNDSIVLYSKPFPGKDFKIVDSALTGNNYTTFKIENQNPSFYRFIYCVLKKPEGDTLLNADAEGIIILPNKSDTVNLLFELSAERMSTFHLDNSKFNSYTLRFEPWIVEVFFNKFSLKYLKDRLEGRHPLLENKKYTYQKEEQ